jgi:hypothetical protein
MSPIKVEGVLKKFQPDQSNEKEASNGKN